MPSTRNCTLVTAKSSVAFAAIATVPLTVALAAGLVTATTGAVVSLATVTVIAAAVASLPAASRATAVNVCAPLASAEVFQDASYGAVVSAPPSATPSRAIRPAVPTKSSVAFAAIATVPLTVALAAGLVTATVGAVVSLATVTVTAVALASLPAASRATAVIVCAPFARAEVFQDA